MHWKRGARRQTHVSGLSWSYSCIRTARSRRCWLIIEPEEASEKSLDLEVGQLKWPGGANNSQSWERGAKMTGSRHLDTKESAFIESQVRGGQRQVLIEWPSLHQEDLETVNIVWHDYKNNRKQVDSSVRRVISRIETADVFQPPITSQNHKRWNKFPRVVRRFWFWFWL